MPPIGIGWLDAPISDEAEFALVKALAAAAPEMLATMPAADAATVKRFRAQLGFKVEDLDQATTGHDSASASNDAPARLQQSLFNEREKPPEAKAGNDIEVFSAPKAKVVRLKSSAACSFSRATLCPSVASPCPHIAPSGFCPAISVEDAVNAKDRLGSYIDLFAPLDEVLADLDKSRQPTATTGLRNESS